MAQEFLEGTSGGPRITALHADMLEELAGAGRRDIPLREIGAFEAAVRRLQSLEPSFDPDWHDAYQALARALADATGDAALPVHASTGIALEPAAHAAGFARSTGSTRARGARPPTSSTSTCRPAPSSAGARRRVGNRPPSPDQAAASCARRARR